MRRRRRAVEAFSISFLDVICCAFGAIILVLVLSKTAEPRVLEAIRADLKEVVADLSKQIFEIRGDTQVLNRQLNSKREQVSEIKQSLARLIGDLATVRGEFTSAQRDLEVQRAISGRLQSAKQELSAEMRRLLGEGYRRPPADTTVGGIPVDSEYIIFIIDTSGSMFNYAWELMLRKVEETLSIYPQVKGIQVMNDMGEYMFSQYAGKWIVDTPARRKAIRRRLATWNPFSNSSPVEGITRAIRTYYAPDKKISLYVFGDEFRWLGHHRCTFRRPDAPAQ